MIQKRGVSGIFFWIVIVVLIFIGGFFVYSFIKQTASEQELADVKSNNEGEGEQNSQFQEENQKITEKASTLKNTSTKIIISGGSGGGGGGSSSTVTSTSPSSPAPETPEDEEESSDQIICQNAQNADLCEGLNIAYGESYKTFCCSEYSLCC